MDLQDLPQFTVLERHDGPDDVVQLVGRLSHLRGVRNLSGALYISGAASVFGELERSGESGERATVRAAAWSVPADLNPGAVLP